MDPIASSPLFRVQAAAAGLWWLDLQLLESRVRVEADEQPFLQDLVQCFAVDPQAPAATRPRPDLLLRVGSRPPDDVEGRRRIIWHHDGAEISFGALLPSELASAVIQWSAEAAAAHHVLHAGAVCRGDRALLLPAGSGSGKSTLTAALVQRGFELLSDEVAALSIATGRVVGHPRRVSLRADVLGDLQLVPGLGHAVPGGVMLQAEDLGGRRSRRAALPALLVMPGHRSGAATGLTRLRPGAAAMALMQASCTRLADKAAALDRIVGLARRIPAFRLSYSDATAAARLLAARFDELIDHPCRG